MPVKSFAVFFMFVLAAAVYPASLPDLRIEPTSGGSIFYVRNSSAHPLKAYLIELVDYPGSAYSYWGDADLQPILPAAEKRIQVTNMTVGAVPDYVKMQAALYADGSTAGTAEKVAQLIARRRSRLETTKELIRRFEESAPEALARDLRQWRESLPPPAKADRNSQAAINYAASSSLIYETIVALGSKSHDEVLATLRATEAALALPT